MRPLWSSLAVDAAGYAAETATTRPRPPMDHPPTPWTRHGSIPHERQSNPWSNDVVRPVALETGTPPSSNHAPARRDEQVDRKHKGSLPLYPLHLSGPFCPHVTAC